MDRWSPERWHPYPRYRDLNPFHLLRHLLVLVRRYRRHAGPGGRAKKQSRSERRREGRRRRRWWGGAGIEIEIETPTTSSPRGYPAYTSSPTPRPRLPPTRPPRRRRPPPAPPAPPARRPPPPRDCDHDDHAPEGRHAALCAALRPVGTGCDGRRQWEWEWEWEEDEIRVEQRVVVVVVVVRGGGT